MRAAVYLRQSLDKNLDEQAISRQREDCLKLCAARGWAPVEYVDNDTSASTRKPRPSYTRMLSDIQGGSIQAIVAWHPDRLYRQVRDLEDLIDLCNDRDIMIATVSGDMDLSTDMGRLVARLLGVVAKGEMERKSARQKRALLQRADAGRPWWSTRPFGYDIEDGVVVLHPIEAPLLQAAYKAVLGGSALYSIMQEWNAAGIKTPFGNDWKDARLREILLNPRNIGIREYNGASHKDAAWPAIVPEEVYRGVVDIITNPDRDHGKSRKRRALLAGIAVCGVEGCGTPLSSAMTKRGVRTYRCKKCFAIGRAQEPIDDAIIRVVAKRLAQPDAVKLLHGNQENVLKLRAEAAKIRKKKKLIAVQLTEDDMDPDQWKIINDGLRDKLADIEARMVDATRGQIFEGVIGATDIEAAFRSRPLKQKRMIIETLLSIRVLPGFKGRAFTKDDVGLTLDVLGRC